MEKKRDISRREFIKKVGFTAAAVGVSSAVLKLLKPAQAAVRDHIPMGRPLPLTGPVSAQGTQRGENNMKNQIVNIEKRSAFAVEINDGHQFRIIQSEGPQLAVLVAFNKKDLSEYFSQGNTRISLGLGPLKRMKSTGVMPYWIEKGDTLISNKWNPMLTLAEDTYGKHDVVFDLCDTFLNVNILRQQKGYPGCRELHADALGKWGIKYEEVPAGVNLFQNTRYSEAGIVVLPTNAKKDDMVLFKAHMDLLISVTACPCPLGESKSIRMEIERGETNRVDS